MKTWKRNAIAATILVLICAGVYLNWNANQIEAVDFTETLNEEQVLNDATLTLSDTSEAQSVSAEEGSSAAESFAKIRLSRQESRDSAVATLQETIVYEDGSETASAAALSLDDIVSDALAESQIESLIIAKGYADCVAYMGDDTIDVAVSVPAEGLAEADVALIKQLPDGAGENELNKIALQIDETVNGSGRVMIGIGTIANHLRDLAKSYKEAQIAIEVGKVFDTERRIINYENLGIGRLIYQLPTTLCEMFLQEVFKKNPIDALDQETLFTINKFFENNLNVSETARKLFVHRNTLVYRLEKIKKLTGLDLREFDDAITFKVALMVKKYLTSRGIEA